MLCGLGIQPAESLLLNVPAEEPRQDVLADDRNVVRHRVRSESTPSDRTRSIPASIPSRSTEGRGMAVTRPCARPAFALRRDITRDDAVDALFAGQIGDKRQAERFATHRCQKAADRVGLPASCLHYGGNGRALFAVEHRKHLSLL